MITNKTYKLRAGEIGEAFCENALNKTLCKTSIFDRLVNNFTDIGFSNFLSVINSGRTYTGEFRNYRVDKNKNRRYIDFVLTDVITGSSEVITWNWLMNDNFFSQLKTALNAYQYSVIQGSDIYSQENYQEKRIYNNKIKPGYGVVYIPSSVGGGGGLPGGGGQIIPTPMPVQTPGQSQPVQTGFDIKSLLENPIVLIGGAALLFFLLKDKL